MKLKLSRGVLDRKAGFVGKAQEPWVAKPSQGRLVKLILKRVRRILGRLYPAIPGANKPFSFKASNTVPACLSLGVPRGDRDQTLPLSLRVVGLTQQRPGIVISSLEHY